MVAGPGVPRAILSRRASSAPPAEEKLAMNLSAKFSLMLILVFAVTMLVAGRLGYDFLQKAARDDVLGHAQLMINSAAATRTYTEKQVAPLFGRGSTFRPQSVPFYAATQTYAYFSADYPEYRYKEAALNPTNPQDRAEDWEADVVEYFRDNPAKTEFSGERRSVTGRALYYAHPIVAEAACMECHGTAAAAPPELVRLYGPDNGFGWKLGEIVGAQIVTVPMSVPLAIADTAFRGMLIYFAGVAALTLVTLNVALNIIVIRPLARAAATADEISKGNVSVAELPVRGKDEIAVFEAAFNRMQRSLVRALELLERQN
jgi:protein-histidine pros-kinase